MHLILPNSVFVHIPKTGGTWVRRALAAAEIPWTTTELIPHADFSELEPLVDGRFTFAFVRHPVAWYRSAWSYRMSHPDKPGPAAMAEHWSEDFDTFVSNCCLHRPGLLTELLERFTGWPVKLDWVGQAENLADGLVEALTLAGEDFDPAAIYGCPPANVSPAQFRESAVYRDETLALLLRAEQGVISRYGYGSDSRALATADAGA